MPDLAPAWPVDLQAVVCEQCDGRYLVPAAGRPGLCPHCFQDSLIPVEQMNLLPYLQPPEQFLPFIVPTAEITQKIREFAGSIWLAPGDLKPENLIKRLQQIYLPMWLVDSQVEAIWQAEAGFNYEVVSYQDRYDQNGGKWASHKIIENHIRWEPRVGRLTRTYDNITAPALEDEALIRQKLGPYDLAKAQPFQAAAVSRSLVRLPDRSPTAAWPDALPALQGAAAQECRRACQADHFRQFRWTAQYRHHNWTLLLLPVYTTYYLDDNQQPRRLLIHGQSGRLSGPRRSSLKRAQRLALIMGAAAGLLFFFSLMIALASFFLARLALIATVGLVIAILLGLFAATPITLAWYFNYRQESAVDATTTL
jgi:hypothetical protein